MTVPHPPTGIDLITGLRAHGPLHLGRFGVAVIREG